ncbi:MAG: hypothetical protein BWK80_61930 [Desulfobacteraceae bacterium IS3]|nr:MAG: hypothetical protein BWK80_61930 [Desulfobacteraceae bacterium IS3]
METFSITHPGHKRKNNEDNFLIKEFADESCFLAVADGMGGQKGGELASRIAVDTLKQYHHDSEDIESHLSGLIMSGHARISQLVQNNPEMRGMGTTLSMASIREHKVYWAHVGDSRIYLFRDGELFRMTKDHTIPGILVQKNKLSEEEARKHPMKNMLLQCVGCKSCEPETGSFKVKPGDLVFLCSDGLYDEISSETIVSILKMEKSWEQKFERLLDSALEHGEIPPEAIILLLQAKQTLQQKFEAMLDAALKAGGSDNITIVGAEM